MEKPWFDKELLDKVEEQINPRHYKRGGVECIEGIKASMTDEQFLGYLKGNAIKYLWRLGLKGSKDAEKAQWYINRIVEEQRADAKG